MSEFKSTNIHFFKLICFQCDPLTNRVKCLIRHFNFITPGNVLMKTRMLYVQRNNSVSFNSFEKVDQPYLIGPVFNPYG